MRRIVTWAVALGVVATLGLSSGSADDKPDKPKYTIKEVMEKAHKAGLYKKVSSGMATKEEKDQLVEYYAALPLNKPPRGDAKAWHTKTEALLKSAQAVAADEKDAVKTLTKNANCMACHNAHQPKK